MTWRKDQDKLWDWLAKKSTDDLLLLPACNSLVPVGCPPSCAARKPFSHMALLSDLAEGASDANRPSLSLEFRHAQCIATDDPHLRGK
jgi:hypothetical protein